MILIIKIILGIILTMVFGFCGWLVPGEIKDRDWSHLVATVIFMLLAALNIFILIIA